MMKPRVDKQPRCRSVTFKLIILSSGIGADLRGACDRRPVLSPIAPMQQRASFAILIYT